MRSSSKQISVRGVLSLLEILIQCITFSAVTVAAYFGAVGKPDEQLYTCFYIVVPVVISYFLRKYINNFNLFIFSNICLVLLGIIVGSGTDEKVFNALIMTAFCGYSIKIKNSAQQAYDSKKEQILESGKNITENEALSLMAQTERVPMAMVAVIIVGYFVGVLSHRIIIMNMEVIFCIMFIVLQILYNNMSKINQVFILNSGKTEFPARQLKNVNSFMTVAAIILILVGMLIFYNGEYGNIFAIMGSIGASIAKIFGRIFLFILGLFGKESDNIPQEPPKEPDAGQLIGGEAYQPSAVMTALIQVFVFVLVIGIIIGLIYCLRVYVRNFNRVRKLGTDKIEYIKPEYKKSSISNDRKLKNVSLSKEEKSVRKLYKAKVLKGTKGKLPDTTSTPIRLTKDTITGDDDKAMKITGIYEKARYSQEKITEEEINIMKNLS